MSGSTGVTETAALTIATEGCAVPGVIMTTPGAGYAVGDIVIVHVTAIDGSVGTVDFTLSAVEIDRADRNGAFD